MNERKLFQSITKKEKIKNEKVRVNFEKDYKEFKFKNSKGITLIALVISIIVMLILAGVSLNATIGDNGIITQAQNATYMQSIAALEEYLQTEYVKYYDETEGYTSKIELLSSKLNNLCLKDGTKNYIIYDGKMYYLINKQALPDDIKNQLKGGDTTEYLKYIRLQDVYGVTPDLKVYYCESGTDSALGTLDSTELDPNTPLKKINQDAEMKSAITEALASVGVTVGENGVTVGDVSKLKDLTIDGSKHNINSIESISELTSLKTLTLNNVNLENLDGLQNCTLLYYVYFKNCKINDYSKLATVLDLQYLYLYLPPTMSKSDANAQVANLGNGLANATEMNKLEYFGISGDTAFFERKHAYSTKDENTQFNVEKYVSNQISNFTNGESLKNIATNIKQSIKYVYMPCNKIDSIEFLEDYKNIYELDLMSNSQLQDLKGLAEHSALKYLALQNCNLNDISNLSTIQNLLILSVHDNSNLSNLVGIENNINMSKLYAQNCNLTDISSLQNLIGLTYAALQNNVNLGNVSCIKNCINVRELYLARNDNMQINSVQEIENVIRQCGNNYTLPNKYLKYFTNVTSYDYANSGFTDYSEEINALKNKSNITFLRLTNNVELGNSRIGIHLKKGSLMSEDLNKIEKNLDLSESEKEVIKKWKGYSSSEISNLADSQIESMEEANDLYIRYLLSTLTGLEELSIGKIDNISKLDFLQNFSDNNKLGELDIRDTGIADLEILEAKGKKIHTLVVSNNKIDFSKIQNVLNNFSSNVISDAYRKSCITGTEIINGNNIGLIICGDGFDFSKCNKVTTFTSNAQSLGDVTKNGITVDLTGMTSLINVDLLGTRDTWILPSKVKDAKVYANSTGDFSRCTELTSIYISWQSAPYYENGLKTLGNAPLTEIHIGFGNNDLSLLDKYLVKAKQTLTTIYMEGTGNSNFRRIKGTFESLKDFKNLEVIRGNGGADSEILKGVENLTNLTNLQLKNCSISDLSGISKLTKLETLELSNNKISDISELSTLKNLKKITLSQNTISDISPLANIVENGKIKFGNLDLSQNSLQTITISGKSNIEILKILYDAGLRTLDISGNNFTSGSTDELKSLNWTSYKE